MSIIDDDSVWATRFADRPDYSPGGHGGVVNRSLAGIDTRQTDRISVWHGEMSPGGHAQPHVHERSDQIYVVIVGRVAVGCEGVRTELGELDAAYITAGSQHWIENISESISRVLVISAPGLPGGLADETAGGNGWAS